MKWVIKRWLYSIRNFPKEVVWFCQRGKRGWADCDAWDWCSVNAVIQRDVIKWLKAHLHGTPSAMYSGCLGESTTRQDIRAMARWDLILNEMVFAFDQLQDDSLIRWFPERIDVDWDGHIQKYPDEVLQTKNDAKRVKRGLKLYCKYYDNLWD